MIDLEALKLFNTAIMNTESTTVSKTYNILQLKSRPKLLNILLFLSTIYVFSTLGTAVQKLSEGPMTEIQLQEEMELAYGSIETLTAQGLSQDNIQAIQLIKDNVAYINNHSFDLTYNLMIVVSLLGFLSILLMFSKQKAGFYAYILYSLASVASIFIITPQDLILFSTLLFVIIPSVVLIFLYNMAMKEVETRDQMLLTFSE